MSLRPAEGFVPMQNVEIDRRVKLAECFVSAGSSALFISIAHINPNLWWFSLYALVPFLWRVIRSTVAVSALLGIIMATCLALVAFPAEAIAAPLSFLTKLLALSAAFALYAILVSRIGKYLGKNAIFIATLWLPLEYVLTHVIEMPDILSISGSNSSLVIRFGSLFGLLMVSFAVVLINSITITIIGFAKMVIHRLHDSATEPDIRRLPSDKIIAVGKCFCIIPGPRSPPFAALRKGRLGF